MITHYFRYISIMLCMMQSCPLLGGADGFYLRTKICPEPVSIVMPNPEDFVAPTTNAVAPDAGVKHKLKTKSGINFEATFIDNNRSQVIVLGQGFPDPARTMRYYMKIFGDAYDYVIFNYRWNNGSETLWRLNTWLQPSREILDNTAEEVTSVVEFVRNQKAYDNVIGLGVCFSTYTFLQAQAQAIKQKTTLFSKLILDSCFFSLYTFIESMSLDPYFKPNEKTGWARHTLHNILQKEFVQTIISNTLYWTIPHVSSINILRDINTIPLLFIHGKSESIVKEPHFEEIWDAVINVKSAAILTPFEHARNINNNKAAYSHIVNTFINNDFNTFTRIMLQAAAPTTPQTTEQLSEQK